MTNHERQIIKYAIKINPDAVISTDELLEAGIPLSREEIRTCAKHMEGNGLIDILSVTLNGDVMLHLSYDGQHPYAIGWEKLKWFLFKSVFVPIVVSVITTLIVMCITS